MAKGRWVDPETGESVPIGHSVTKKVGDEFKHFDKWGKELTNKNGVPLVYEPAPIDKIEFNLGKFSMMSKEDQRKSLRKRAREDSMKNKGERFHEINRKVNGLMNDL